MRTLLQVLIIIVSIFLGLYVGIWLMFTGGIIQIINGINLLNAVEIAIGICKVLFCEIAVLIPIAGIFIAGAIEK